MHMLSINKVQLFGNLTRDPELKTLQGGACVCNVGLATNRTWTDKEGNKQEETTFHNLVVWGKMGETIAQYMKKGHNAYFEGRIKIDEWEEEGGAKRTAAKIVVESFQFGINKRDENGGGASNAPAEDELPEF